MIIKDHKDNINRELSLVEQKKMQWAKEREEMAKLEQYHSKLASKYERNTIRTQLITNTEIVHQNNNNFHQKNFNMRLRSPSLPPIERFDKTMTRQGSNNSDQSSGYLSGSGGSSSLPPSSIAIETQNDYDYNYGQTHFDSMSSNNLPQKGHSNKYSLTSSLNEYPSSSNNERDVDYDGLQKPIGTPSSESSVTSQDVFSVSSFANSSTMDSSINYHKSREGRAKWSSYLFDSFSKNNTNDGRSSRTTTTNGPVWLEKSLSEARDSEEETMSISVQSVSSFLRGQNVPVDPFILREREAKRRKAMELQQAIKEQLEERENLKKIEREKLWQQEKIEEERLARQMEIERLRLEKEQRILNEKLENERKKEEAMRKALEMAAIEAQKERERRRKERTLALQSSLDETISIQKIGEKTEIYIEGCQKSLTSSSPTVAEVKTRKDTPVKIESVIEPVKNKNECHSTPVKNSNTNTEVSDNNDDEDEDDGETILIGTPIKLKKKNLENFRRKFHRLNNQHGDELKTSDEELSTPKTIKSTDSNNMNEKNSAKSTTTTATAKTISDLEGIAIVLQTMPIMPTFVPLTNEMFGFNQLNNLAFLMAAQNRLNSPNVMLPIIPREISTPSSNEKLDLSQFLPPNNPSSTITLQIQQVDNNNNTMLMRQNVVDDKIKSIPSTPESQLQQQHQQQIIQKIEVVGNSPKINEPLAEIQQVFHNEKLKSLTPHTPPQKDTNECVENVKANTPSIPHDGTFTKEEQPTQADANTSTDNENFQMNFREDEIKILTPQKYRTKPRLDVNARTVSTQTESFLFCEYCSYQHHSHHHHRCSHSHSMSLDDNNINSTADSSNNMNTPNHQEISTKPKEKKAPVEERPKWGVRNPPIKYLKASERDPFYGKSRKKRYLKKAASESEKNDDSCGYKECPLIKSPLLSKRSIKQQQQQNRENLCTNLMPMIKTDRFGRVNLVDEQNFIMSEAMRRYKTEYASDTECSSIDVKHKSFFLPRANDFQDIFVD